MGDAVEPWRHVGRLYSAGQPFLALDVRLLEAWHGTDEQLDELIELGDRTATVPVGDGAAGIIAVGGVNDEGWLEVFQQGADRIAVVQGSGRTYRDVMVRALSYPSALTQADDAVIEIGSGELALWDSAMDGARWVPADLRHAVAGRLPADGQPLHVNSPLPSPGLRISVRPGTLQMQVRWMVELDDDACFARWLLIHDNKRASVACRGQ